MALVITNVIIDARLIAKDLSGVDVHEERKYLYLTLRIIELRKFRSKKPVDRSFERIEAEETLLKLTISEIEASKTQYYDKLNGLSNEVVLGWYRELLGEYQTILRKEFATGRRFQ